MIKPFIFNNLQIFQSNWSQFQSVKYLTFAILITSNYITVKTLKWRVRLLFSFFTFDVDLREGRPVRKSLESWRKKNYSNFVNLSCVNAMQPELINKLCSMNSQHLKERFQLNCDTDCCLTTSRLCFRENLDSSLNWHTRKAQIPKFSFDTNRKDQEICFQICF